MLHHKNKFSISKNALLFFHTFYTPSSVLQLVHLMAHKISDLRRKEIVPPWSSNFVWPPNSFANGQCSSSFLVCMWALLKWALHGLIFSKGMLQKPSPQLISKFFLQLSVLGPILVPCQWINYLPHTMALSKLPSHCGHQWKQQLVPQPDQKRLLDQHQLATVPSVVMKPFSTVPFSAASVNGASSQDTIPQDAVTAAHPM